jgi:hypothetical protein
MVNGHASDKLLESNPQFGYVTSERDARYGLRFSKQRLGVLKLARELSGRTPRVEHNRRLGQTKIKGVSNIYDYVGMLQHLNT